MNGYDDDVALEFSKNFEQLNNHEFSSMVKDLEISGIEKMLIKVMWLPRGHP